MKSMDWVAKLKRNYVFCAVLSLSAALALPVHGANEPRLVPAQHEKPLHAPKTTRVLVGEVGFRNEAYDRLKKTYGYSWLYPQAFAIDPRARELFVMLGSMSGKNRWGWIQVYDLDDFKLKSTFSTGQRWREGLVIRQIGAQRFLYTMGNDSLVRLNISTLPRGIEVVESEPLPARALSMMSFDGKHFALQQPHGPGGYFGAQQFALYDEQFHRKETVTLTTPETGGLSFPEGGAKLQGIAFAANRIYAGYGGAYLPGGRKKDGKWQGTAMFDRNGNLLSSSLTAPDAMLSSLMQAIGYRPTCVENEGVAIADGAVYSIWITLGPKDREKPANEGKGVVLMRELFTAGGGDR